MNLLRLSEMKWSPQKNGLSCPPTLLAPMPSIEKRPTNPVYTSSLRELKWILVIWTIAFLWVIGYCGLYSYLDTEQASSITTILGMPSWVFFGVFVPWIVGTTTSIWFAISQIEDLPLDHQTMDDPIAEDSSQESLR